MIRRVVLVTLGVLLIAFSGTLWQIARRNLAAVHLNKALAASDAESVLRHSRQAVRLYQARAGGDTSDDLLRQAFALQWQAASALGLEQEALGAFRAANPAPGPVACQPDLGSHEAETFAGVAPGTKASPRRYGDVDAVLLFAAAPLADTVCIPEAGLYAITVTARLFGPPPAELAIAYDGWAAGVLRFQEAGENWTQQSLLVASPPGAHSLSLTFINDLFDPDLAVDRNVAVDAVDIGLAQ